MLVNLIGEHCHLRMAGKHFYQTLKLLTRVDAARRIRRRAEKHHARALVDGGFELRGSHLEILVDSGGNQHVDASGELHQLDVADPCGHRDHHLVAGVDDGLDHIVQRMLCSGANHHILSAVAQTIFRLELLGDSLAKRRIAGHRRIVGHIAVDGVFGGILNVLGRIEVGLAHRKVDYIHARSFQLRALGRHGQRCRRGHLPDSLCYMHLFHNFSILLPPRDFRLPRNYLQRYKINPYLPILPFFSLYALSLKISL